MMGFFVNELWGMFEEVEFWSMGIRLFKNWVIFKVGNWIFKIFVWICLDNLFFVMDDWLRV